MQTGAITLPLAIGAVNAHCKLIIPERNHPSPSCEITVFSRPMCNRTLKPGYQAGRWKYAKYSYQCKILVKPVGTLSMCTHHHFSTSNISHFVQSARLYFLIWQPAKMKFRISARLARCRQAHSLDCQLDLLRAARPSEDPSESPKDAAPDSITENSHHARTSAIGHHAGVACWQG